MSDGGAASPPEFAPGDEGSTALGAAIPLARPSHRPDPSRRCANPEFSSRHAPSRWRYGQSGTHRVRLRDVQSRARGVPDVRATSLTCPVRVRSLHRRMAPRGRSSDDGGARSWRSTSPRRRLIPVASVVAPLRRRRAGSVDQRRGHTAPPEGRGTRRSRRAGVHGTGGRPQVVSAVQTTAAAASRARERVRPNEPPPPRAAPRRPGRATDLRPTPPAPTPRPHHRDSESPSR